MIRASGCPSPTFFPRESHLCRDTEIQAVGGIVLQPKPKTCILPISAGGTGLLTKSSPFSYPETTNHTHPSVVHFSAPNFAGPITGQLLRTPIRESRRSPPPCTPPSWGWEALGRSNLGDISKSNAVLLTQRILSNIRMKDQGQDQLRPLQKIAY